MHSYKDLPTAPEPGLAMAAVPVRADPRDALVARDRLTLGELPAGARVGTGAPRRMAQLRALGLGLEVVPIRGNVDTRMARVVPGDLDAVVLARAGLARLGRLDAVTETLDPLQVLPAPAQGALAVECRADDERTLELLAPLDDAGTRACVVAERATLTALEAGCSAPVAAYAELAEGDDGPELYLRASVTAIDGSDGVRGSATGPVGDAGRLGRDAGPGGGVVEGREQLHHPGVVAAALHGQRALSGCGQHLDRVEDLGHGRQPAQPGEAGPGQDDGVELARGHLGHPGVDVAADRHDLQAEPQRVELRGPAR